MSTENLQDWIELGEYVLDFNDRENKPLKLTREFLLKHIKSPDIVKFNGVTLIRKTANVEDILAPKIESKLSDKQTSYVSKVQKGVLKEASMKLLYDLAQKQESGQITILEKLPEGSEEGAKPKSIKIPSGLDSLFQSGYATWKQRNKDFQLGSLDDTEVMKLFVKTSTEGDLVDLKNVDYNEVEKQ